MGVAKGAAFAAGAAGIGGFFAVLHEGINEIKESQQVTAATNAVIKSTGGVAGVSTKQVDKLALSISNLSGFDDEAVKHGENLLLTFRNIRNNAGKGNDIFNQSTLALANMAAAFKDAGEKGALGAAGSTNFQAIAIRLGKALQDPVRGLTTLRRVGVQFTKTQEELIKKFVATNKIVKAQKLILKELTAEFGGQAAAAGKTLAGQLGVLHARFKDLSGVLLGAFVPSFTKAVAAVTDFVKRLSAAKGFRAKFNIIWDGVRKAASKLFDLIASAVRNLAVTFRAKLTVLWTGISEAAGTATDALGKAIASVDWDKVFTQARGIADAFQKKLQEVDFDVIGKRIGDAFSKAAKVALPAAKDIATRISNAISAIDTEKLGRALGPGLAAAVATAFVTLTDPAFWLRNWDLALAIGLTAFGGSIGRIAGALGADLLRPFARFAPEISATLVAGVKGIGPRLAAELGNLGLVIAGAIERIAPRTAQLFLNVFLKLPRLVLAPLNALTGVVERTFGRLGGLSKFVVKVLGIQAAINAVVNLGKQIGGVFSGLISGAVDFGKDLIGGIGRGIDSAKTAVIRKLLEFVNKILGVTGFLGRFDPFKGVREKVQAHLRGMEADTRTSSRKIKASLDSIRGKEVKIGVSEHGTGQVQRAIDAIKGKDVLIRIKTTIENVLVPGDVVPPTGTPPGQARQQRGPTAAIGRATAAPFVPEGKTAAEIAKAAAKAAAALRKKIENLFKKFDTELARAQLTPSLKDDLAVLENERAVLQEQLSLHKGNLDLQKRLADVQQQIQQAQKDAFQRSLQVLDIALSKAGLTKTLSDDLAVLERQRSALEKQVKLHKDDLDLRQQLVGVQGQINSLNQQAVSDAKNLFGTLFQLTQDQLTATFQGGTRGKKLLAGNVDAGSLLTTITRQNQGFAQLTRNIATLVKRGAPVGLIRAAQSGELPPQTVAVLAHANAGVLAKIFRQFRISERNTARFAKVEINTKSVAVHANRLTLPPGQARLQLGTPIIRQKGGTVFVIENLHTNARNGAELEADLTRRSKGRGNQRRGRVGGHR